jgi:hypothetical protein
MPRRSRSERVAVYGATILGVVLIGIAVWGVWVSADVARLAGSKGATKAEQSAGEAAFLLVWLVVFGPFLYFGALVLRSVVTREGRAWLVPLRLFTYIVSLRAKAEMRRPDSGKRKDSKTHPAPGPQKRLGP